MNYLSIGIPVYNEAAHIKAAISSLQAQTWTDFKAIISDNCSTDETFDICVDAIRGDSRFHLVRHPRNMGAVYNFEYVMRVADSNYFLWLGAHDFLSELYLERLMALLNRTPSAPMAFGRLVVVKADGVRVDRTANSVYRFSENPLNRFLESVAKLSDCSIIHSVFRKSLLDGFQFRPVISIDHVMLSTLLWHGNVAYDDEATYFRREPQGRAIEQPEEQMQRITGAGRTVSRHEFVRCYLDAFEHLYPGDPRIRESLNTQIVRVLAARFGETCVLPPM